jgi:hypothetical protein
MLDSGSSVCLVRQSVLDGVKGIMDIARQDNRLVTAAGEIIPVLKCVSIPVRLGPYQGDHPFLIVDDLITPAILGLDFLQAHRLTINFTTSPISIISPHSTEPDHSNHSSLDLDQCTIAREAELSDNTVGECAIPHFNEASTCELPDCANLPGMSPLIQEFSQLFSSTPGKTSLAKHFVPTSGTPVKVPPRRVPANYRVEVEEQLTSMLEKGIIEESSSPWMAPAVYVRKKTGDLRMCVDYRELNKKTTKDAYPLPRPDEVQDRLCGSTIYSTLDLSSGYWQVPLNEEDRPKTAFCPGPGMGLFQFTRMPFGLTGAPSSFQRLMDKVCRGLPFTLTYLDDFLIYSPSPEEHIQHLREVFTRLQQAGLTLKGPKCHLGLSQVTYLGHIFSATGMKPDPSKLSAIQDWPMPTSVSGVRSFLGLASYYRRYMDQFAEIATPLYRLT